MQALNLVARLHVADGSDDYCHAIGAADGGGPGPGPGGCSPSDLCSILDTLQLLYAPHGTVQLLQEVEVAIDAAAATAATVVAATATPSTMPSMPILIFANPHCSHYHSSLLSGPLQVLVHERVMLPGRSQAVYEGDALQWWRHLSPGTAADVV